MKWLQQHRALSLIVVLSVPGLAAAMLALPEEVEQEISVQELPDAIQKGLKGVVIDEVEVSSSGYEIEIEQAGIEVELRLDKGGRLLGIEIEDDSNNDADDQQGDDDEETAKTVDLSLIPSPARAAISKFAAGNAIELVEQDEKDGHTLFEAMWRIDGVEHEATVTAGGVLVELEEVTTADAIPEEVRKQSDRYFKDGRDMKFERKLIAAYEIEGIVNGKAREHLVTTTGAEIEFEHDDEVEDE